MDPNSGKPGMFNKLSKKQAIAVLENEEFSRTTISFYKYTVINLPNELRDILYKSWSQKNILGRIYIAQEGINAQISIPNHNIQSFKRDLESNKYLKDISYKIAVEDDGKSFFKLTIKVRKQIVADGLSLNEYDVTNVGKHLNAKQWNNAIKNGALVVDMRNHYESEIGRFKGAICPDVETFKEELPIVKELLKDKKKKKILLYCTGGIRCEKTSAYLKHHGYQDVNQLHGGIIDYARQIKADPSLDNYFQGKNFVFDERRGERISKDVISSCHQCGKKCDDHVNCQNVNCNLLFIQCIECQKIYENCCSTDCIEVKQLPKEEQKLLRKGKNNKKMYYSHKRVKLKLKK